jgi:hypothetical protein
MVTFLIFSPDAAEHRSVFSEAGSQLKRKDRLAVQLNLWQNWTYSSLSRGRTNDNILLNDALN